MEPITRTETMKYTFTDTERVQIAQELARHLNQLDTYESELDQIKADYKYKVSSEESAVSACKLRITSGYEMRPVQLLVLKFRPHEKQKLIVRLDNGRARIEKMEPVEAQMMLTTEPTPYAWECDFAEDIEGQLSAILAEDVPLTEAEAALLRDLVPMRPATRKLEA